MLEEEGRKVENRTQTTNQWSIIYKLTQCTNQ